MSQPGVKRDDGWRGRCWVVRRPSFRRVARQHAAEVKSLVFLSGETLQDGLQFLQQASQLPGLFVVADDDEYPPTVEAMELHTSPPPTRARTSYTTLRSKTLLGYGTKPPVSTKYPPPAATERTCSKSIRG